MQFVPFHFVVAEHQEELKQLQTKRQASSYSKFYFKVFLVKVLDLSLRKQVVDQVHRPSHWGVKATTKVFKKSFVWLSHKDVQVFYNFVVPRIPKKKAWNSSLVRSKPDLPNWDKGALVIPILLGIPKPRLLLHFLISIGSHAMAFLSVLVLLRTKFKFQSFFEIKFLEPELCALLSITHKWRAWHRTFKNATKCHKKSRWMETLSTILLGLCSTIFKIKDLKPRATNEVNQICFLCKKTVYCNTTFQVGLHCLVNQYSSSQFCELVNSLVGFKQLSWETRLVASWLEPHL